MTQGSCAQICKWIVILFNVILIVVGLASFGGGFYLRVTAGETTGSEFIFVIGLCMGIGTLTVFAVCFGDYGSSKENKICLSLYGGLLILLATASVLGGIVAYVRNDEFADHILKFYLTIYYQYMKRSDVFRGFMLKVFHNELNCCGAGGILQTLVGATNICPPETFWGINIASACTRDILDIQANSVLFMFLGIAGVLILPLVCASYIWQQLSHPVLVSPPYIPLSSKKLSSDSPPPTPGPLSSPPPYTEHVVKVECI